MNGAWRPNADRAAASSAAAAAASAAAAAAVPVTNGPPGGSAVVAPAAVAPSTHGAWPPSGPSYFGPGPSQQLQAQQLQAQPWPAPIGFPPTSFAPMSGTWTSSPSTTATMVPSMSGPGPATSSRAPWGNSAPMQRDKYKTITDECALCCEQKKEVNLFVTCGHFPFCNGCMRNLSRGTVGDHLACPCCRKIVTEVRLLYRVKKEE